jgi:SAM-dependent methyltransferase
MQNQIQRLPRMARLAFWLVALVGLGACGTADDQRTGAAAPPVETGAAADGSINPGINERYLDPSMDADEVAQGFEDEGREVYERRMDVLAVLDLQPGMAIADIGAGSGFYADLMLPKIGTSGHIYLVEISERWLDYLREKFAASEQVSVVEGSEREVMLPANSVDLVFASDTYHHFEYPAETLASIHRALRPGGRFVILDYDRIPGVTPGGRMNHLRLGKVEAIREIVAEGFQLERDVDLNFRENYLAIFSKVQ